MSSPEKRARSTTKLKPIPPTGGRERIQDIKLGRLDYLSNAASAEGRDEKKTGSASGAPAAPPPQTKYGGDKEDQDFDHLPKKKKWFCCG